MTKAVTVFYSLNWPWTYLAWPRFLTAGRALT
jgi:2-hydroxychromene-2-carboxylate isomerase